MNNKFELYKLNLRGKKYIIIHFNGAEILKSYDTISIVCWKKKIYINKDIIGWSQTTNNHLKQGLGLKGKDWENFKKGIMPSDDYISLTEEEIRNKLLKK